MRRAIIFSSFLILIVGCGDDDGGTDAGGGDGGTDAGPPDTDAGRDAGPPDTDAGPSCTSGCAFVEIATGLGHACARRENGSIRCWGSNAEGQVGDGRMGHGADCADSGATERSDCTAPVDVSIIDDATQISGRGGFSSCAVRGDSSVWCWGLQPVSDMEGSDLLPERFTPEEIAGMGPLTDLSDGWSHMCGVSGGQARCIYSNGFGQIGDGMTMTVRTPFTVPTPGSVGGEQVVDVEVGAMGSYTCALLDSAEIWCWGIDDNFQLGAGDAARDTCTSRGFDRRCSLAPVQMMVPAGVTPVQMSLGNRHGCFVDDTGQLYCWGQNSGGQLGLGNTDIQNVPVAVPAMDDVTLVRAGLRATCALDGTGQLWCWGAGGTEGTIGDGLMDHGATCDVGSGVFDCVSTPQMVETLSDVTTFDMSWAFGCAIRASGEIWCWGDNDRRQLANGADREPQFSPVLAQGTD